jgi:hypothetical protein
MTAGVLMPGPGWHHKRIAKLPLEALTVDDRKSATLRHLIDSTGYVAVGAGVLVSAEQLQIAAHRGQRRAA